MLSLISSLSMQPSGAKSLSHSVKKVSNNSSSTEVKRMLETAAIMEGHCQRNLCEHSFCGRKRTRESSSSVLTVSYTHLDVYKRQVNVQSMAFGNMGDDCGTGVAFTRDPATGENGLFGEFLTNAQGEDCLLYTSRCV